VNPRHPVGDVAAWHSHLHDGHTFTEEPAMEISFRNQLKGKIVEILRGDVVSEVDIDTAAGRITSVVTTRSLDRMKLKPGDDVFAAIKATEVGIEKP
jgi:molybdopterin-binding protein